MSKVLYRPPRFGKKKKATLFWGLILLKILPALLILGGLFYFLFFSPYFYVKEIKILNNETIPENVLSDRANEIISKKIYFFLSAHNIFLFPSKKISNTLLDEFPRIGKVSVKKKFPGQINIKIEERKMVAIWCGLAPSPPTCFFIDKDGVIFENSPSGEGTLIFRINDKLNRENIKLGERVFEPDFINKIFEDQKKFEESLGLNFPEFTVLEDNVLEANSSSGWKIIFDASGKLDSQIRALKKILEEMKPEEKQALEYFDLRIEGRIYYK